MTAWTDPRTWSSGDIPTAALLNTHIRDNLLHLSETLNEFGFPYTLDPRVAAGSGVSIGLVTTGRYFRIRGAGTITKIRIRVTTSAGNIAVAAYTHIAAGLLSAPDIRLAASGAAGCPAAGSADLLLDMSATVIPGDYFGLSNDAGAMSLAGSVGAPISCGLSWYEYGGSPHPIPDKADIGGLKNTVHLHMIGVA